MIRMIQLASIVQVAGQEWSSTWVADGLEKRPGYERLHQLIDHATNRLGLESLEDPPKEYRVWASLVVLRSEPLKGEANRCRKGSE